MSELEIPDWLKRLPLAPEYHPSETEFADPIAYISKIEKEASAFGICKIIPPLPKPSKKYVLSNLKRSLSKCPDLVVNSNSSEIYTHSQGVSGDSGSEVCAVFTTRHQELGHSSKKNRGPVSFPQPDIYKQVWQSGELYTLDQFESKSKTLARSLFSNVKEVSALLVETLFWKAASDKAIYVEYANDVPGSGFGEPQEPFQYFHRRKRKRKSHGGSISNEEHEVENKREPQSTHEEVLTLKTFCDNDREGTAGWKLSNSPWNLQVIAKSAGSLTRFMPDEIPGVTSPMVYIGMLFSWFAWHVEDHELHSLNFLHMGSPKTWYAVPGDHAFALEELIRVDGYGGNLDRLAALAILGEKTTLMSPEVVVSSGIPCCRLVQNPGEFIVTFPRAYHVGFSHGFNCGEAANFATPQWLKVAKEAAVRRAAMNYLPMLSHQQLLYLLSMSFISRIPRELLPGIRSSRFKDRKKEEKEVIVKKAFIDDMVKENYLLNSLLGKGSTYYAVLWDPEMLPSSSNGSSGLPVEKNEEVDGAEYGSSNMEALGQDDDSGKTNIPSSYMEQLENIYYEEDDLPCGLHMDSGALACVACGILGFPFMAILQPSEEGFKEILSRDNGQCKDQATQSSCFVETRKCTDSEGKEEDKIKGSSPRSELDAPLMEASVVGATLDSCHLILQDKGFDNSIVINPCKAVGVKDVAELLRHRNSQSVTRPWNTSNRFFRPRVFCLEHATEVEELLASKGGANVLIICHSDFSKIKEQAVFIAEEMGIDFRVEVGSLNDPSRDDLELINLSIGDDENEECGEDWTSKLGVNLKFFVKLRKMSSMQEQHALALGGLFSDLTPTVDVPGLKWISRKSRTRHEAKYSCRSRSYGKKDCANSENFSNEPKNSGGSNAESSPIAADGKPRGRGRPRKYPAGGISQVKIIASSDEVVLASNCGNEKVEASSVISFSSTTSVSMHQTSGEQEQKRLSDKSVLADKTDCCTDSLDTPDLITEVQTLELSNGLMAWRADNSQMEDEIRANLEADLESEQSDIAASSGLARISISGSQLSERQRILKSMEESPTYDEACCSSKDPPNSSAGEANPPNSVVMRKISAIALSAAEISQQQIVNQVTSQLTSVAEAHYPKCLDGEAQSTLTDRVNSETKAEICSGEGTAPRSMICSKDGQDISRHIILVYSKKRRKLSDQKAKDHDSIGFIRSPCEGLRPRKSAGAINSIHVCHFSEGKSQKKLKKATCTTPKILSKPEEEAYGCNIEGCQMSFTTKAELSLHKRNRCTYRGCGKQFSSHKYASHHQKVHTDERPLKCPWKGCHMSFKWAWARTEHLRVHTGERPYKCNVEGCGLTFRFVSDFSRHRRKTGHSVSL